MRKRMKSLRSLARYARRASSGASWRVQVRASLLVLALALSVALFGGMALSGELDATAAAAPAAVTWPALEAVGVGPAPETVATAAPAEFDAGELLTRASRASVLLGAVEEYLWREVVPLERVLLQYRPDPALARRIAVALAGEARKADLDPRLLLAVLLVENSMLDPTARSSVGATGLMQVMPMHRGHWPCGPDLESIETNICYGAHIFAHYYRTESGDVERALLRYNGCVRGTNTPNCHRYPYHVYARAGRASILAWLRAPAGSAASP